MSKKEKQSETGYLSLNVVNNMDVEIEGKDINLDFTTDEIIGVAIVFRSKEIAEKYGPSLKVSCVPSERMFFKYPGKQAQPDPEPIPGPESLHTVYVICDDDTEYYRLATAEEIELNRRKGYVKESGYDGVTFDFRN